MSDGFLYALGAFIAVILVICVIGILFYLLLHTGILQNMIKSTIREALHL